MHIVGHLVQQNTFFISEKIAKCRSTYSRTRSDHIFIRISVRIVTVVGIVLRLHYLTVQCFLIQSGATTNAFSIDASVLVFDLPKISHVGGYIVVESSLRYNLLSALLLMACCFKQTFPTSVCEKHNNGRDTVGVVGKDEQ